MNPIRNRPRFQRGVRNNPGAQRGGFISAILPTNLLAFAHGHGRRQRGGTISPWAMPPPEVMDAYRIASHAALKERRRRRSRRRSRKTY